jgi:hypothetical protein
MCEDADLPSTIINVIWNFIGKCLMKIPLATLQFITYFLVKWVAKKRIMLLAAIWFTSLS